MNADRLRCDSPIYHAQAASSTTPTTHHAATVCCYFPTFLFSSAMNAPPRFGCSSRACMTKG